MFIFPERYLYVFFNTFLSLPMADAHIPHEHFSILRISYYSNI